MHKNAVGLAAATDDVIKMAAPTPCKKLDCPLAQVSFGQQGNACCAIAIYIFSAAQGSLSLLG